MLEKILRIIYNISGDFMKRKQIIFLILSILATIFIFSNSLKSAQLSSKDSSVIVDIIKNAAKSLGAEVNESFVGSLTVIVRKAAHVSEFALQAFLVSLFLRSLGFSLWEKAPAALLCGLLTACTDEAIQLLSPGRASLVTDVFIDFIGVIIGFCAAFALLYFRRVGGSRR